MRTVVASFAALALAVPAGALAQPDSTSGGGAPGTYVDVRFGAFLPRSKDTEALDPNVEIGGTVGGRFNRYLSAELDLAYYRASATTATEKNVLEAVPVTASVRLRYPTRVAEVSVFAGGGLHFAHAWTGSPDVAGSHASSRDAALGYHLGAEAAFNLSRTMRVGIEARETFVTAKFDGADVDIGGLGLAATLGWHL